MVRQDWNLHLDDAITADLRKYRGYHGSSVRDLLRALRNKVSNSLSSYLSTCSLNYVLRNITTTNCHTKCKWFLVPYQWTSPSIGYNVFPTSSHTVFMHSKNIPVKMLLNFTMTHRFVTPNQSISIVRQTIAYGRIS